MKTELLAQIYVDVKVNIKYTPKIKGTFTQLMEHAFVEIESVILGNLDITEELKNQYFDFKALEERMLEAYETQIFEGFGAD